MATILEDCLYNIISDTVLKVHREEKIARMQSAAVIAQQKKDKAKAEAAPSEETPSITTEGAMITADDRIFLHGNPLSTTTENFCPTCRLVRLNHPVTGKKSQMPDSSKEYCSKQPYIEKEGCDIYGKSLTLEKPSKKKSAAAKPTKTDSRSASESPGGSPNPNKSESKPAATTIPSGKCPNCPRYMAFTRIAQHMDRCLGVSGRQSSKNALTKMSSNTPQNNSRASTPKPTAPPITNTPSNSTANNKKRKLEKGSDDEGDEEKTNITVKKKKVAAPKKDGKAKAVNADIARVKGAAAGKRLPGNEENSVVVVKDGKKDDN